MARRKRKSKLSYSAILRRRVIERGKKLKKIGAIDIKLNRRLSESDREKINRVYRDLKFVADNPSLFANLKQVSLGQKRALKGGGVFSYGSHAWVQKKWKKSGVRAFDKIMLIDKRLVTYRKETMAKGRIATRKEITYFDKNLVKRLEKLIDEELPEDTYLVARIDTKDPFGFAYTQADKKRLAQYLVDMLKRDPRLIGHVSIAKFINR